MNACVLCLHGQIIDEGRAVKCQNETVTILIGRLAAKGFLCSNIRDSNDCLFYHRNPCVRRCVLCRYYEGFWGTKQDRGVCVCSAERHPFWEKTPARASTIRPLMHGGNCPAFLEE